MDNIELAKKKLNRTLARHRLDALANFREIPVVELEEIPIKRSKFPYNKKDYWQLIETNIEDNKTMLMYELAPFGVFSSHYHLNIKEICNIITEEAKIEWVTEKGISHLKTPCKVEALENEEHALVSHSPFYITILVTYTPKMEGWKAIFRQLDNSKKIKNTENE